MKRVMDEAFLGTDPLDHATELGTDMTHNAKQRLVRHGRHVQEELEYGRDVRPGEHGEGERRVHAHPTGGLGPRKVGIDSDVVNPGRLPGRGHATRQPPSDGEPCALRFQPKTLEPFRGGHVPDATRPESSARFGSI